MNISPRPIFTASIAVVAFLSGIPATHGQKADPAAVQEHIAAATAAAKSDLLGPLGLCKTATPTPGPASWTIIVPR